MLGRSKMTADDRIMKYAVTKGKEGYQLVAQVEYKSMAKEEVAMDPNREIIARGEINNPTFGDLYLIKSFVRAANVGGVFDTQSLEAELRERVTQ
jgi:hypothetical protein